MRSRWKPLFFFKKKTNYFYRKNIVLNSSFLGERIYVYNGYNFQSRLVRSGMVFRKLGEFFLTKKQGIIIHKSIINKKKRKK